MNKWLIIFAILLTACTGTSEKSEECITIDLATVFDHQPQEVALKKWAKSIQFIPLQTNDSILIKYISRIIKHGDMGANDNTRDLRVQFFLDQRTGTIRTGLLR